MSRDEHTEPMTRVLGTIARTPDHDDPHGQLANGEQTRLEIARPKLAAAEPATKIEDPSTFRKLLSLDATLSSTPRTGPHDEVTGQRPRSSIGTHDEVTVPRPRVSIGTHRENTAPQPQRRTMPFALAVLLAVVCLATGASLLRPRARDLKPLAAQTQPVEGTPEPSTPVEPAVIAELERRAVDRLRDNDHPGALALYRELTNVATQQPAYPVMVSLLERRLHPCQGEPGCAR